jgi:hypothetical protein
LLPLPQFRLSTRCQLLKRSLGRLGYNLKTFQTWTQTRDSETSEESFWDYKGSDGSSQTEYSDLEDLADEESEEEEEEETDESEEEEGHPDSGDESDDESEVPKVGYKYKKVADKVRPQAIKYPEHLKPHRQFPSDPLKNLPTLPYHPPIFSPPPR